jgi:hypothetical protein
MNICDANPRNALGVPPFTGVQSNALYLQIFIADYTAGTQCPYNSETEGRVYCTGQQIAPSLVLTAEHCLSAAGVRADPDCANAEVTDIIGKCLKHQLPNGLWEDWVECVVGRLQQRGCIVAAAKGPA